MTLANALLVRWSQGWGEVTAPTSIATFGRHELLLGLGAARTFDEVNVIAQRMLNIYADVREQISADLQPSSATETPYIGFGVGDTITVPDSTGAATAERIMALTVSQDDDGTITYAPELKDIVLTRAERYEQAIKKMVDGTASGTMKAATPVAVTGSVVTSPSCCAPVPPPTLTFVDLTGSFTETGLWTVDRTLTGPVSFRLVGTFPASAPGTNVTIWLDCADPAIGYTFDMWSGLQGSVDISGGIHEGVTGSFASGDTVSAEVSPEPYDGSWSATITILFAGGGGPVTIALDGGAS